MVLFKIRNIIVLSVLVVILILTCSNAKPIKSSYITYKEGFAAYEGDFFINMVGTVVGHRYTLKKDVDFEFIQDLYFEDEKLISQIMLKEIKYKDKLMLADMLKNKIIDKPFSFTTNKFMNDIQVPEKVQQDVFYIGALLAVIYSPIPDKEMIKGEKYSYDFNFEITYLKEKYIIDVKFDNELDKLELRDGKKVAEFSDDVNVLVYHENRKNKIGSANGTRNWILNMTNGNLDYYNLELDIPKIEFHITGNSFFAISGNVRGEIKLSFGKK